MIYTSKFIGDDPIEAISWATMGACCGDTVVIDRSYKFSVAIGLSKPGIKYEIRGKMDFMGSSGHGFLPQAAGITISGVRGLPTIVNMGLSGVYIDPSAPYCTLRDLDISGYNTVNAEMGANAGVFACSGGPNAPVSDLTVTGLHAHDGNGNGLRIGGVVRGKFKDILVERTHGYSSEGITVNGRQCTFTNIRVDRANVTGLLIFGSKSWEMNCLDFTGYLQISNSSQITLLPPTDPMYQSTHNAAMQIDTEDGVISCVTIDKLTAFDTQATPTQNNPLLLTDGGQGGTLYYLCSQLIEGYGNIQQAKWESGFREASQMVGCVLPPQQ